jgi:hypothetical protein
VKAARAAQNPETGLECLRLIEDRLRRTSFASVQDSVGRTLLEAVADYAVRFPEIALQSIALSSVGADLKESWFGRGTLEGFRMLAQDEPDRLLALRNAPSLAGMILTAEPDVGAAFVRAAASHKEDAQVRADLLRWMSNVHDHELRAALRKAVVSDLGADDTDILRELLKDLREGDISFVLDAVWNRTHQFEADAVRDLIVERVARDYPNETRSWARRLSSWAPAAADVFAATYPPTRQGLLELLDVDAELSSDQRAEVVAAFMHALGSGSYTYWFREVAREQISLLLVLLDGSSSPNVSKQIQKLLTETPDLTIAPSPELLRKVLDSSERTFFKGLLDITMRGLISGYVAGTVSEAVTRPFQEHEAIAPWFRSVDSRDLSSLVTNDTWSSDLRWFNAWRWTSIAPEPLYGREPTPLFHLIDSLSRSHYSGWSQEIAAMWAQILRRCRSESHRDRTRLVLYVQALKFSFEHSRLPLGAVVAEAFHYVYTRVTESPTVPVEAAPMFSMFDWDKGKELRRELVDCFYHSQWSAGDLVVAANDVRLLRKIFKRLMKKPGGERYAWAAVTDLEGRTDQKAAALSGPLRSLLSHPDFYEEWD